MADRFAGKGFRIPVGKSGLALYSAIQVHGRAAVGVAALLGALIVVILLLGNAGVLDLEFVVSRWHTLWGPTLTSLVLTMISFGLGFVLAVPLGLVRAYVPVMFRRPFRAAAGDRPSRIERSLFGRTRRGRAAGRILLVPTYGLASGYVEAIRGTPFYVQMWIVFYLISFTSPRLPNLFLLIGIVVLTLSTVGYQAEVLRAGFQSVGQGQIDAAKAIGMRGHRIFAHVTLPQALRLVVLPLTNECIGLFKVSAILSFISVQELLFQAGELGSNQGHPIEAFLMVAVMYCAILIPLGRVVTYFEKRKRIPGLGTSVDQSGADRRRTRPVT